MRSSRLVLFLCLLWIAACSREGSPPPNVILVTLDTTRADRLGCYGHAAAITPTLDSLAARGVVFERAISSVPVTLPSHSTILTGVSPLRHGVRDNGIFELPEELETLAERLKAQGYQTGAFVSAYVLGKHFGTGQGFTTYDDRIVGERAAIPTSRHALRWLEKLDRSRPYFLWVHYYDPHEPWTPPEPFKSMTQLEPYDQEIAGLDAGIRWFFRGLEAGGFLQNTAILVVSDHGEGLGDHGESQHGVFLYDETIRVPMILVFPDGRFAGRRVSDVVATEDVTPTLLQVAGFPVPDSLDGHGLVPWLAGETDSPRTYAYSETYFPTFNFHHSNIFSLRSDRWKYIRGPIPELYHVRRDPKESIDLVRSYPDTATAYHRRIDELRGSVGVSAEGTRAISKEELERLQSLGYLGGGEFAAEMDPSGEFDLPDPKHMRPFIDEFEKGLTAMTDERFEDAAEHLERVVAGHRDNVIAHMNLGRVYNRMQQFDKALLHLEEAHLLAPNSRSCAKLLGDTYQALGRYGEAIAILESIAQDETHGPPAQVEIGRTQLLMGHPEAALFTFRTLAERVGGDANNYTPLAERVEGYLAARDRLEAEPHDEAARLKLAEVALDFRLLEEAESALDFRSDNPIVEAHRHRNLGSLAGLRGDDASARREFEIALRQLPGDPYLSAQLIGFYLDSGELDRALEMAEVLIQGGQADKSTLYNKACALSRKGDIEGALDALRQSIRLGYDNLLHLNRDPELETVRRDPRFADLLETVGETEGTP